MGDIHSITPDDTSDHGHASTAIVTVIDGQAVTTSLAIAEGTGGEHASVIKLARTYLVDLEEFGRVRFEIRPFATDGVPV